MKRSLLLCVLAGAVVGSAPAVASAEPVAFKLMPNYSRATFRTDAPLETVEGHTPAAGLAGTLNLDPSRPQGAQGGVRVDMNTVATGIEKRDADMRGKNFLDTESEPNRFVTFDVKSVEIAGPLEPGKTVPAKVRGVLRIKQKAIERVADATVTYIKLSPAEVESQKRFGFTAENLKIRAKLATTFTDHGMQVPQLLFLKVSNEIQIETDLTFTRQ